jgi:hypothetical protein
MREAQKEAEDEIGALRAERMAAYEQERDKVGKMLLGAYLGWTSDTSDMRTRATCAHIALARIKLQRSTIIPRCERSNLSAPQGGAPSHAPCDVEIVTQRVG